MAVSWAAWTGARMAVQKAVHWAVWSAFHWAAYWALGSAVRWAETRAEHLDAWRVERMVDHSDVRKAARTVLN